MYDGIQEHYKSYKWLMERCILSPHNESANEINEKMIEIMPGEEITSYSADKVCRQERNDEDNENDFEDVPIEFLNTLNYPGFPRHELKLKKHMVLMLMRNLNKKQGLCNGTRLILEEVMGSTLKCYNPVRDEMVFIPRIELRSDVKKGGFLWKRRQFPVQPAFSMTINKSQGQTIKGKLGVYLYRSVFSHGELYVALSWFTMQQNVKMPLQRQVKWKTLY